MYPFCMSSVNLLILSCRGHGAVRGEDRGQDGSGQGHMANPLGPVQGPHNRQMGKQMDGVAQTWTGTIGGQVPVVHELCAHPGLLSSCQYEEVTFEFTQVGTLPSCCPVTLLPCIS